MTKQSHSAIFAIQNFVQNTNVSVFFFFTLKLFTLDYPAVRLTHGFNLYFRDHVCKGNEWCLVNCFFCKFRVFCIWWAFNGPLCQFFVIQNIYINLNPDRT